MFKFRKGLWVLLMFIIILYVLLRNGLFFVLFGLFVMFIVVLKKLFLKGLMECFFIEFLFWDFYVRFILDELVLFFNFENFFLKIFVFKGFLFVKNGLRFLKFLYFFVVFELSCKFVWLILFLLLFLFAFEVFVKLNLKLLYIWGEIERLIVLFL